MFDATFWVAISFVIFCLIIIYKKIPQLISNLLDSKINEIKSEIDNAKNLKHESEKLFLRRDRPRALPAPVSSPDPG